MTAHAVEVIHMAAADWSPVIRRDFMHEGRFVLMPRRCPDCSGNVETIPPDDGFTAALLLIHDPSCPAFGAMRIREAGGAS